MIGSYQLDGNDGYSFGRERQFALFQVYHWAKADVCLQILITQVSTIFLTFLL